MVKVVKKAKENESLIELFLTTDSRMAPLLLRKREKERAGERERENRYQYCFHALIKLFCVSVFFLCFKLLH